LGKEWHEVQTAGVFVKQQHLFPAEAKAKQGVFGCVWKEFGFGVKAYNVI